MIDLPSGASTRDWLWLHSYVPIQALVLTAGLLLLESPQLGQGLALVALAAALTFAWVRWIAPKFAGVQPDRLRASYQQSLQIRLAGVWHGARLRHVFTLGDRVWLSVTLAEPIAGRRSSHVLVLGKRQSGDAGWRDLNRWLVWWQRRLNET